MRIGRIDHKGLANFYERGSTAKIDVRLAAKLRVQFGFIETMSASDELQALPFWKPHRLSDGRWSFHVTANWRLTFNVDDALGEVFGIDLEDYH
jgi:plasmid maintenance system killer protein